MTDLAHGHPQICRYGVATGGYFPVGSRSDMLARQHYVGGFILRAHRGRRCIGGCPAGCRSVRGEHGSNNITMKKSLRRLLLGKLVARRPAEALLLSCERLHVSGVHLQVPEGSPLFKAGRGESIELPLDDVIAPFVLNHGQWQMEEVDFICAHRPERSVLIDVGANIGLITRQLLHRVSGIEAAVCFEPHPANFRFLTRNLAHLPHCHLLQAAVGATEGELRFYEEVGNVGNYSLNLDAMRGKRYRTSVVRCVRADEAQLLGQLPEPLRAHPLIWKSDTQGFDETIMTSLPDSFWNRVHAGVMEIWRIERPAFDRERLGIVLGGFNVRRFGDEPLRNLAVEEILSYTSGTDYRHRDLFFARA